MLVEHILHTDNVNANLPDSVLGWKQSRTKLFIFNSRYIHLKPPKIKNLKVNCVVLQACNNGSYLRNRLRNVLLILEKPIFKIGSCTCLIRNLLFDTVKCWNFEAWLDIFTICWKWHFFWKIIGASPTIKLLKIFPK